jgi:hypothetical protein
MNCQAEFSAIVLSQSCQSIVLNASCADLSSATLPPDLASCFPPCSTTTDVCNSNGTITTCSGNATYVFECTGVCSAQSKSYTGTCAASYMGHQATNGQSCWCQ